MTTQVEEVLLGPNESATIVVVFLATEKLLSHRFEKERRKSKITRETSSKGSSKDKREGLASYEEDAAKTSHRSVKFEANIYYTVVNQDTLDDSGGVACRTSDAGKGRSASTSATPSKRTRPRSAGSSRSRSSSSDPQSLPQSSTAGTVVKLTAQVCRSSKSQIVPWWPKNLDLRCEKHVSNPAYNNLTPLHL